MNRLISLALAALLSGSLAACATPSPAPAAQTVATAAPQAPDRTCQTDDDTGSHLRKKTVCTTAGDDAQDRRAMDNALRQQRTAGFGSTGGH